MKVEELYDEMGTSDSHLAHLQQADNEDYEVVVEGCTDGLVGGPAPVSYVRWDHEMKHLVVGLE